MHVHVLGAGCLGLSAALALAERGHDVTMEDPRPGGGATGKAAGIVSTMTWNDDDFHLVQRTRGRIGELIAEAAMEGRDVRSTWRSIDSLAVAAGDGLRHMDEVQQRLERLGEEPERLDAAAARAAYPMLVFADGEEVLVAQEDGYVEPGDLLDLLQWACQQAGVRTSKRGRAEATIIAVGAWSPAMVPLPLASFRAQLASIGFVRDIPMVHDTVHGFYMRPESPASILVGDGTRLWPHDPDDYDEAADPGFREDVAAGLVERVHEAGEAVWRRGWAGLCVGTPDRHPVCGRVPGHDDRYVLTGDNGYGIMRCLALGERLADAVDGDEAPPTSPSRFAGFDEEWELQEGFAW